VNIQLLVEQMALEETAALCTEATAWTCTPINGLGVPEMSAPGLLQQLQRQDG